uniref:WD repeat-containing and planar cell polarity effector protein fritz n=1 Tax=Trichogramma kaykai TaxID=54128 RepID=A0ABD2WPH6_9HYME
MFVLLGELNFWTFDSDVDVKDTDFGAFSYHDKKFENVYEEGKKSYAQMRGMVYVPQNKKGNKLKDNIKYLEEQLATYSTVYCQWFDYCTIQLMLSSGLLIYVQVNLCSGDIQKIIFDKYLIGKLSERLSDVIITKNYLVCTYNDTQVTLISFAKSKKSIFDKINKLDSKIVTFDLCGPAGRRLEKKIQHNKSEDLILIWWKSTMNEVFPWSPTVKEHDRANVHLYRIIGSKLELLCYLRTEFDPLCITFHTSYNNVFHSLEQKVSRKGEVTVEWRTYEVSQNDKLQKIAIVSVPLPTHTSCVKFSPNQDILLLCCIDGTITLHDQVKSINNIIKTAFIPTLACWHSDGHLFAVANERGQVQYFDIALNCLKSQMTGEDIAPANVIDLSSYFRTQPALIRLEWAKKNEPNTFVDYYNHGDSLIFLLFERGPIAILRSIESDNLGGDVLVQKYLGLSLVQQATSLLLAMNWDLHPQACMHSLNQIVNFLFKMPLTPDRENLIQNALGSFHVPAKPLSQAVIDEYGNEVRDLTRRFFHYLLRYRLFEKAFRLAIDLSDHDLFMDIHFYAVVLKDTEMAAAAKEKAEEIISRCNSSNSSHSTCSRPSCSICSDSESDKDESYSEDTESEEPPRKEKLHSKRMPKLNYPKSPNSQVPPLPVVYTPVYNNGGFMSTSFNETVDSTHNNLMSTSFNLPSSNITPVSLSYSASDLIPNTLLSARPYNSTSATFSLITTPTFTQPVNYDNLVSPVESLSIINQLTPSVAQLSLNSMSLENIANPYQSANIVPSAIPTSICDTKPVEITSSTMSSIVTNTTSNLMTTSFTNFSSNTISFSENGNNVQKNTEFNSNNTFSSGIKTNSPLTSSALSNLPINKTEITLKTSSEINESPSPPIFNSVSNLMSTSFNDPVDTNDDSNGNSCDSSSNSNSTKDHSASNIPPPPPPLITDTLSSYMQNLPKKSFSLSGSTPGLLDLDNSFSKLQHAQPLHAPPSFLPHQNSVSNILQSHHRNNIQATRKYRLDYDLDYIPFHNSCDNLSSSNAHTSHIKSNNYNFSPKPFDSKLYKLGISQSSVNVNSIRDYRPSSNVPPLPIITTSSNEKLSSPSTTPLDTVATVTDKPKVKFSDTVTHILVPTSGPTYRPIRSVTQLHPMDPKRELADSLPLCLGNEDYLKDFQPLSNGLDKVKDSIKTEEPAKIKVVHFGLL